MTDQRRTTRYRSPLANGAQRNQLVRFFVSTDPATFDRLRAHALATDQPLTQTASDLLKTALDSLKATDR